MKHSTIILAALLISISMQAQQVQQSLVNKQAIPQPHSVAIMFGSVDGVSYRIFVDEHWAIQTLLMWKYLSTYGTTVNYYTTDEFGKLQDSQTTEWGKLYGWTTELNPNFIYQNAIHQWEWGTLYWNSGAGISLGFAQDWKVAHDYPWWGKFGVNTISGFELGFSKVPISVFTESFAGYGLLWNRHEQSISTTQVQTQSLNHFIDWGSDVGIRYAF